MTKSGVMDAFGVLRNFGLAVLTIGVLFLGLSLAVNTGLGALSMSRLSLAAGLIGLSLALAGFVLALTGSLTRLFVSWTRFRAESVTNDG